MKELYCQSDVMRRCHHNLDLRRSWFTRTSLSKLCKLITGFCICERRCASRDVRNIGDVKSANRAAAMQQRGCSFESLRKRKDKKIIQRKRWSRFIERWRTRMRSQETDPRLLFRKQKQSTRAQWSAFFPVSVIADSFRPNPERTMSGGHGWGDPGAHKSAQDSRKPTISREARSRSVQICRHRSWSSATVLIIKRSAYLSTRALASACWCCCSPWSWSLVTSGVLVLNSQEALSRRMESVPATKDSAIFGNRNLNPVVVIGEGKVPSEGAEGTCDREGKVLGVQSLPKMEQRIKWNVKRASTCLILRGSAVRPTVQAKGTEFRSGIVKPISKFAVHSIRQWTPSIQRTSSPCFKTNSRSAHYTPNYSEASTSL